MEFIYNYAKKDIGIALDYLESRKQVKRMDSHPTSEEEMTKEQEEMMARKIQEKMEKKHGGKKNSRKGISA